MSTHLELLKRAADALAKKDKTLAAEIEAALRPVEAEDEQTRLLREATTDMLRRSGYGNAVPVLKFDGRPYRFSIDRKHDGMYDCFKDIGSAVIVAHPADGKLGLPSLWIGCFCEHCAAEVKWTPAGARSLHPREAEALKKRWAEAARLARELNAEQLRWIEDFKARRAERNAAIEAAATLAQERATRSRRAWHYTGISND